MKKFSILLLVTAVLLSGCSLIKANDVKTSALLGYDYPPTSTSSGGVSQPTMQPQPTQTTNQQSQPTQVQPMQPQPTQPQTTQTTNQPQPTQPQTTQPQPMQTNQTVVCDSTGNCYVDDGVCDPVTGNCYKQPQNNQQYVQPYSGGQSSTTTTNTTNCDSSGKCWDNNGEVGGGGNDCFSGANPDCKNKALKADIRDIDRMEKEITQLTKKQSASATDLNSLYTKLEVLKQTLNSSTSQEEVDTTRDQIREVQASLDKYRMADEAERVKKDVEREKKQYEKDKKFLEKDSKSADSETQKKISEYLASREKMSSLENDLLTALTSGEQDRDKIDEIRTQLDDLRMATDDFWQWYQPKQTQKWAGQMFTDVEKNIERFQKEAYKNLSADMKTKADEIIKTMKDLVAQGKEAAKNDDQDKLQEIQDKLQEIGIKTETLFGKIEQPKFEDMGYDKSVDQNFTQYSENMSYEKQVELVKKILSANPDIIKEILESDPMLAERTMKILDKVPEKMQSDYLNGKADLSSLYNEVWKNNKEIGNYKELILDYNYFGDSLKTLVSLMEEVRDGTLSVGELVSKLEALKQDAKQAKYESGVTSFPDYDDSDWYYEPVEGMKDFLKGKDGKFAGQDRITFAETLKITLERFSYGQSDKNPDYPGMGNHWAKGYYAKAEELGITLMDPQHYITRGEMAKLIVEATLKTPKPITTSSFSDVSVSDPDLSYIETLKGYGIVSGDSSTGTYRPADNINRAETAKVIEYAYETLQMETLDVNTLTE